MQAWLAGHVQEFPILRHLYHRFCTDATGSASAVAASEQPAPATSQPAERASFPAAAAALAQSQDDSAQHHSQGSDVAVTQQVAHEDNVAQANLPPAIR